MSSIPCKAFECLPLELAYLKQQAHTVTMITTWLWEEKWYLPQCISSEHRNL